MLPEFEVSSAARDGAVIADIASQLGQLPRTMTHMVVSIGGNDAIRASGVIDESAISVFSALEKIAMVAERFAQSYAGMVRLLSERSIPTALCTIYDPRFPDFGRRRVSTTALTVLNDAITRQAFGTGASLIDLRIICNQDEDFANAIEPSVLGGGKIARAIAAFAKGSGATAAVFGQS